VPFFLLFLLIGAGVGWQLDLLTAAGVAAGGTALAVLLYLLLPRNRRDRLNAHYRSDRTHTTGL